MKYMLAILTAFLLTACGGPPDDVVRQAIITSQSEGQYYTVQKWKETNSYSKKENAEDIKYIEYEATLEIKPEFRNWIKPGGTGATVQVKGTTAVVKRGSSWYMAR